MVTQKKRITKGKKSTKRTSKTKTLKTVGKTLGAVAALTTIAGLTRHLLKKNGDQKVPIPVVPVKLDDCEQKLLKLSKLLRAEINQLNEENKRLTTLLGKCDAYVIHINKEIELLTK
jgi:peptidoglycan hydrolase CwlO-like protein